MEHPHSGQFLILNNCLSFILIYRVVKLVMTQNIQPFYSKMSLLLFAVSAK